MNNLDKLFESVNYHHNLIKWHKSHLPAQVINTTTYAGLSVLFGAYQLMTSQCHRPLSERASASTPDGSLLPALAIASPKEEVVIHPREQLKIHQPELQQSSFETVTRYLPNCEALLAESAGREREIAVLCEDLQQADVKAILARYKEEPDLLSKDALRAFHDGKIKIEQFCTLNYCFALLTEFLSAKIHVQPLFDASGNIDPIAKAIFERNLYAHPKTSNFFMQEEAERIAVDFFELMRDPDIPESERCFFYFKSDPPKPGGYPPSIRYTLRDQVGLRLFDGFSQKGHFFRMVPSFSMIQALVDAYGGQNTIALCPRIKMSKREDFRANLNLRGREIYVPCFGIKHPEKADGFLVSDSFSFLFHDIYHALVCTTVPYSLQIEAGRIADSIAILQKEFAYDEDPMNIAFLETLYGRVVDLEFANFRLGMRVDPKYRLQDLSNEEVLLFELDEQLFIHTFARMQLKQFHLLSQDQRGKLSEAERAALAPWDAIKELIDYTFAQSSSGEEAPSESELVKAEIFKEMCDQFYLHNEVVKAVAEELENNGILDRLHITKENLARIENVLAARYEEEFRPYFLVHYLANFLERRQRHDE